MTDPAGPSSLEIVNPDHPRGPFRCAVFDFDGTLSLLRGNWQGLMVPMMVETLTATGTAESAHTMTTIVDEFVTRLTGRPTMQQIVALAEEVKKRGGPPVDKQTYLASYLELLLSRTVQRIDDVHSGRESADSMLIPGSRPLLESFSAHGWLLAIFSGTELSHVQRESRVLQIDRFFGNRIFGPIDNDAGFSKERTLRELMAKHQLLGSEIVVIGDGPAEILAAKSVGSLALGVASDEVHRDGRVNSLKRDHLLRANADIIIPDYHNLASIAQLLSLAPSP